MLTKTPIFSQLPDQPTAHCATLTQLPNGALLAAWFGGAYETAPDVVILAASRHPLDKKWSQPRIIAKVTGHALGQPVFLLRPDGELWLFFNVIMAQDWTSAQPYWQRSLDHGETWQAPESLLDYPGLMFRSRPVILPGRIILPVYDEKSWQSLMLISDDQGQTWRLTAPLSTPNGNIHPCVVCLPNGHLLAYLRPGGAGGVIWRSESFDRGETWSQPTATNLPNPNSGLDLLRLQSGSLVLAFNNSNRQRTPLCVAWAKEDELWRRPQTLEDAPGEFSYPTLLQTNDEHIHLVYTYRREHIHHACFTEKWLREAKNDHS